MSNLHSPMNPRHSRLFELLRQQENAAQVTTQSKLQFHKATPQEIEMLKSEAGRTLARRH